MYGTTEVIRMKLNMKIKWHVIKDMPLTAEQNWLMSGILNNFGGMADICEEALLEDHGLHFDDVKVDIGDNGELGEFIAPQKVEHTCNAYGYMKLYWHYLQIKEELLEDDYDNYTETALEKLNDFIDYMDSLDNVKDSLDGKEVILEIREDAE